MSLAWRRNVVRRRGIVNLKSGRTFRGILWKQSGPLVIMRQAEMLEAGREPIPVDGEVVIERSEIEFIQLTITEGR